MLLKYLFIKRYKKFENFELDLYNNGKNELMKKIYDNLNITVFVGENGVGKTTILSFITIIFKNLQRYHDRIPSEFKLIYEIENKDKEEVTIEKRGRSIYFTINKIEKLLLQFDVKTRTYIEPKEVRFQGLKVTYADIKEYLPSEVIVSCFDINYPSDYTWNYIGHRLLKISRITTSYTESGFGMDISKGIMNFLTEYFCDANIELKDFFKSMGFNLSKYLYIYRKFPIENEDKEKIVKDFYREFKCKSWKQFLQKTRFTRKKDFIEYIFSNDFWNQYVEEDNYENPGFEYNDKFNAKKFIDGNFFNLEVLKRLIEFEVFYINEFFIIKNEETLSLNMLSTGEKTFLCRLFFLLSKVKNDSLVILEEPEIHLNYSWVKQLITVISLLFKDYKVHFLISTHSHAFINTLFPENIIILEKWKARHPDFNTFLANEKEINKRLFENSSIKNKVEKEIIELIKKATKNELAEMMNFLGESYLKYMVYKRMIESDENVETNE